MREDWEECCFEDLLDYEQPTNYIVKSTAYNDAYETPVLTAGKSFIKGYTNETEGIFDNLPTIIFDDFTTATQFVNFKFKVKSSAMKILVPTSELVNMDFAYYAMQVNQIRSDTHKRYWISVYAKKKFLLPSLLEQKAIVSKIEELFSDLDKGVADLKKAQQQLKVYRQAVLKKAFEGDFTKSWRDSKKLNSDWTTYTFAEITESLKRGPFGGDLKKSFFVENGYAVYEQQHAINNDFTTIRYHIDQERYEKLKACNVGPGDYIVSCSGTMGKIARLPKGSPNGVINQALLRIRINESIISHEYFLEHFKSALFQRKILKDSRGSGMQNMAGIKEIKPIRIKVPTLPEQSQIIKEIESRLSVCDQLEESISESLNKAEALRQSILKKAFQGRLLSNEEIERCKAVPDYEPAAVLLQKIKNL